MRLLHAPWLRTLVLSLFVFYFAVLYCKFNFYRDPGSRFFDRSRAYERSYSLLRAQQGGKYIDHVSSTQPQVYQKAGKQPELCATYVSVRRDGEQYLPLALASTLDGLSSEERSRLILNVFIAHVDMNTHPTAAIKWPYEVTDNITNYNVSPEQLEKLANLEATKNFAEKAVYDYTYALQDCYNTGAPWIALFEDDILLAEGWFVKTIRALYKIDDYPKNSAPKWLFMRLFNQERSTGWASRDIGGNNELLIASCVAPPVALFLWWLQRSSRFGRRNIDSISIAIICLFVIPSFIVLFFQAGKASLLPPRPGVREEPFGCCSQGLVFPRRQIPRVNEYLLSRAHGQIDNMLDDLAEKDDLARYALYPVQLQHVGVRSARKTLEQESQAIWSMAFEQQDSKKLRKEHRELVKLTYPPANDQHIP